MLTPFQKRVYPVRKISLFKSTYPIKKSKDIFNPKEKLKSSNFSNRVYEIVKKILQGKVMSYQSVARKLGNKNLARAVGNALRKNRDPKISCHRVIRKNGKIGGFNRGEKQKILLLRKEGWHQL